MVPITLAQAEKFKKDYPSMFSRKEYGSLVLFDYHYKDPEVMGYDSPARDLRGIIFDQDGTVASLPLRTFYNTKELPGREPSYNGYYSEKQDGSMVQMSWHRGRLLVASRSSMSGYVATSVKISPDLEAYIKAYPEYTFMFEFLDPDHTIVIPHHKEELVFLVARHKTSGEYSHDFYPPGTRVNKRYPLQTGEWNQIKESLDTKHTEGVVIWSDGDFWKYKTPWYIGLHSVATNFRPESVLYIWAIGEFDDLSSIMREYDREDLLRESEELISEFSDRLEDVANRLLSLARSSATAKEAALTLPRRTALEKIMFGAVMEAYRKDALQDSGFILNRVKNTLTINKVKEILID